MVCADLEGAKKQGKPFTMMAANSIKTGEESTGQAQKGSAGTGGTVG